MPPSLPPPACAGGHGGLEEEVILRAIATVIKLPLMKIAAITQTLFSLQILVLVAPVDLLLAWPLVHAIV